MKKLFKRIDFVILQNVILALALILNLTFNKGEYLITNILAGVLAVVTPLYTLHMLIYCADYRRNNENNAPAYLEWFFKTRSIFLKIITVIAILAPLGVSVLLPTVELPLERLALLFIILSFSFGMLYQPYDIYKGLIDSDWFNKNDYRIKQ